ncbi:GNAT family N-acetyltransferase [Methylorubrum extorquens]|nr:GNAT family N-acetyltransferase [Methylorubrum extorquens]MCP1545988.1 GNAT superfamily N-acetyltransferase [Methylorubrum extorquens]MCP1590655.1 GNAT superfamily N-acetyltransferase [Methylorubrum extorquens]
MTDPMPAFPEWRPLLPADLPRVRAISEIVHPDLPERLDVLSEKRALFPEGCLGFGGSEILGYGLAHPWVLGRIPALDGFLGGLPHSPDCLYVHDVALLPAARGQGGASRYIAAMAAMARSRGLRRLACVAVYGAERLWSALGFEEVADEASEPKLRSYGEGALFMVRRL